MPQSGLKRGGLNRQRNWRGPQEAESIQTSSNIASVMRAARTRSPRRRAGPETVSKGPIEADYGHAHPEDSHLKPVVDVVSTQYDEKSRMNDDRIGKESFGHTGATHRALHRESCVPCAPSTDEWNQCPKCYTRRASRLLAQGLRCAKAALSALPAAGFDGRLDKRVPSVNDVFNIGMCKHWSRRAGARVRARDCSCRSR
jgi:hypothetical protein